MSANEVVLEASLEAFRERVECFIDAAVQDGDRADGEPPAYWALVVRNEAKFLLQRGADAYIQYAAENTSVEDGTSGLRVVRDHD